MCAESPSGNSIWTVGRLLNWTTDYLARCRIDEPRLIGEVLLAHALGCRRIDLYVRFEQQPEQCVLDAFRGLVKRAAAHEPTAYLVGEKEFFSLNFVVTPDVLIPRPETESLVESVIDHCHRAGLEQPLLLDVGTGSGCIAISVLTQLPGARGVASDVSAAALEVARRNGERHGVLDRLELLEADRLDLPRASVPPDGFDLVVSNPPYVASSEIGGLEAGVREREPRKALTDEEDGLSFYRAFAAGAGALLKPDGRLFVEVEAGRAADVRAVFDSSPLRHIETVRERAGGIERVLIFAST